MDTKQVEQWLVSESKKNNSLAISYLSLLKDAQPEMRQYWFDFLGNMMGPLIENKEEIKKAIKEGK